MINNKIMHFSIPGGMHSVYIICKRKDEKDEFLYCLNLTKFDVTMIVPISQEKFLSNRYNKKNFIEMLIEQL